MNTFIKYLQIKNIRVMTVLPAASLLLALFVPAGAVWAQATSGDVVGTVKDTSGAVIPNAAISVTNEDTGIATTTQSGSSGQYHVANLLTGTYAEVVNASGIE